MDIKNISTKAEFLNALRELDGRICDGYIKDLNNYQYLGLRAGMIDLIKQVKAYLN